MADRVRRGGRTVLLALAVVVCAGALAGGAGTAAEAGAHPEPIGSLRHDGRWFTDAAGRVVLLRGVNFVEKWAPFTPEADGFGDDDAALVAASGFDTVRLGVVFEFLMPQPGRIDRRYLDSITRTVDLLGRHGLRVLLDFHQDGWGPVTHGNGMPAWATLTDGLPNPAAPFPLYYVQNPALQRAFDNFWANRAGPDGVPLQRHYARAMRAVAARFASRTNVLGYEAMNEPWPGSTWQPCLQSCPDLERRLLVPFYTRMAAAVRSVDHRHPLFVEPFVLFNFFGGAGTSLPGRRSGDALSTHAYATSEAGNASVMDQSLAAATRDRAAVLVTEWGATDDPAVIDHTADQFDARLLPWLYWSYNGHIVTDSHQPLVAPNLHEPVLDALARPHPRVVNGTPLDLAFDAATRTLQFAFATRRPDGGRAAPGLATTIVVPRRQYPGGYHVAVAGATVTSRPCAPVLILRNDAPAAVVFVRTTPGSCR